MNVNKLLFVDVDICTEYDNVNEKCLNKDIYTDVWVFDLEPYLQDYLWKYNNQGTKLLQLRFYPCVIDPDGLASNFCVDELGDPIVPKKNDVIISDSGMYENVTIAWSGVRNDYF